MADHISDGQDIVIAEIKEDIVFKTSPQAPQAGPGQTLVFEKYVGSVIKNDVEDVDYVVPSGKTLKIEIITGSLFETATPSSDFYASLTWDATGTPEILDYVRGFDFNHPLSETLVGDGVKILRLTIHNETPTDTKVSCRWIGFLEDT